MQRSLSLLAAGLVAVHAQLQGLPQCGQTCVSNMLEIAVSDFGCDASDLASCACCNADFGYGIRDCSRQVCGDGSADYSSVISYGSSYCASAATTCPSGTQATTVLATATGSSGSGASGSGSSSMPAMTSGPLAGAVGAINSVSGSSDAYAVGSTTITAGGDAYSTGGTAYSALPSGGGVLVSGGNAQTTYVPGSGAGGSNSSSMTMTSGSGSGGALGGAASSVSNVQGSQGVYAIGDNTISAGGDGYANGGTSYSALPSGLGVVVAAAGSSTTYNPASQPGGAGMVTGQSTMSSSMSGGSGGGAGGAGQSSGGGSGGGSGQSSSSGGSGNGAPIATAAPALIGAAAMAILAL